MAMPLAKMLVVAGRYDEARIAVSGAVQDEVHLNEAAHRL
jgi:hypothetical protein